METSPGTPSRTRTGASEVNLSPLVPGGEPPGRTLSLPFSLIFHTRAFRDPEVMHGPEPGLKPEDHRRYPTLWRSRPPAQAGPGSGPSSLWDGSPRVLSGTIHPGSDIEGVNRSTRPYDKAGSAPAERSRSRAEGGGRVTNVPIPEWAPSSMALGVRWPSLVARVRPRWVGETEERGAGRRGPPELLRPLGGQTSTTRDPFRQGREEFSGSEELLYRGVGGDLPEVPGDPGRVVGGPSSHGERS